LPSFFELLGSPGFGNAIQAGEAKDNADVPARLPLWYLDIPLFTL
jgi:hypothetical protein